LLHEIKPIVRKVLEPVDLFGRNTVLLFRQTASIPQDAVEYDAYIRTEVLNGDFKETFRSYKGDFLIT